MKKIIQDIKKEEKGAISTLVLFTILIFIVILMGTYLGITTMQRSQLKSDMRIQEIYGAEVNSVDEIYKQMTKYAVTFNGTNVTSDGASFIKYNETYTAKMTLTSGYGVSNIVVKMGETTLVEDTDFTYLNETLSIPNVNEDIEITIETLPTVESKKTAELAYFTTKTVLVDSNRNMIQVPEGFKIAEDSGNNVTEGIVIEDDDIIEGIGNNRGNQYVWIPVGTGIRKSDNTKIDIILGRYTFASDGTKTLVQSAENYLDEKGINTYFKELVTSRIGVASSGTNTTALDLKGFIDSVEENGGYYIARYEASYGTDKKVNSKVSNSYGTSAPTTEGTLWNNVTQIDAATASRGLYETATTDLINSYAWDTAIVYIQEFSGDTDYSEQEGVSINSSLANTGTNGDEVCKINDMASNTYEWTTEYSTYTDSSYAYSCTRRGGGFSNSSSNTSGRYYNNAVYIGNSSTFRSVLHM